MIRITHATNRRPIRGGIAVAARFTAIGIALAACGRAGPEADAGGNAGSDAAELARAVSLARGIDMLPPRADVLTLARAVEARAVREGAGTRAAELHAVAAHLFERVWRTERHEEDAKDAIDAYHAAARERAVPPACDSAVRGAELAGDVARDAAVTYTELYRAQRTNGGAPSASGGESDGGRAGLDARGDVSGCAAAIARTLAALDAYRPAARVLEAIDDGLAGEGALGSGAAAGDRARIADAGGRPRGPPKVMSVDEWAGEESARVVVTLDRPARFRIGDEPVAHSEGARTFLELDGVDVAEVPRDDALTGVVTRVRAEATTTGARVTLDLSGRAYRRVFHLLEPYRIVVDIARHPPGAPASGVRAVTRVAIDPGHGGSDPGAIGASGLKEKDVTLDIAHRVAPVLARQNLQVLLTRDGDRYVPLEERTARANAFGADLFVSIHCNAADNRTRRGVETYVLDTTKDEMAGRIAARENATSQAANAELASILASMRLADQSSRSSHFADLLQRTALAALKTDYADISGGGVKTAGFYVLVGARMPGVLFETSYVSNAIDEERLGDPAYRQRLADGIVNAVKAYREGR